MPTFWGCGQHQSTQETFFEMRLTREYNSGNYKRILETSSSLWWKFCSSLLIKCSIQGWHLCFQNLKVPPGLWRLNEIPKESRDYITGTCHPTPGTRVVELHVLTSMEVGQLRVVYNSHFPSERIEGHQAFRRSFYEMEVIVWHIVLPTLQFLISLAVREYFYHLTSHCPVTQWGIWPNWDTNVMGEYSIPKVGLHSQHICHAMLLFIRHELRGYIGSTRIMPSMIATRVASHVRDM